LRGAIVAFRVLIENELKKVSAVPRRLQHLQHVSLKKNWKLRIYDKTLLVILGEKGEMETMNKRIPNEPPHKLMLRFVFGVIFMLAAVVLLSYFFLSLLYIKEYFIGNVFSWMPPLRTVVMEAAFSLVFGVVFLALSFYMLKPYIELAMKGAGKE